MNLIYKILFYFTLTLIISGCTNQVKKYEPDTEFSINPNIEVSHKSLGLPMCGAFLVVKDFSHALNAIVTGDSVLKYDDWLIIDAQNAFIFSHGKPNIPNSCLRIVVPDFLYPQVDKSYSHSGYIELVRFEFDSAGRPKATYYYPDLVLNREPPSLTSRKN